MNLTKKETARVAAKLLCNIYGENVDAVATIVNAEAKVLEGDNSGATTLADAHNPLLIYSLSKVSEVNFIETTKGYVKKIKKQIDSIVKGD